MSLTSFLPAQQIRVPLLARTKTGVIDELLELLPIDDPATRRAVRDAVFAREAEASTGIGRGVAIPHALTTAVDGHLCAFGVSRMPIAFEAVDSEPCRLFFLFVSNPEDAKRHLEWLSEVASILNDGARRTPLEEAGSAEDVRKALGASAAVTTDASAAVTI